MFNRIREYNYKINCTAQIITIKANVMSFLSNNLYRRIVALLLFTILLITKNVYYQDNNDKSIALSDGL